VRSGDGARCLRTNVVVTAEARKTDGGLADRCGDYFGKAVHELSE
jgi:hypothetical protein